MAGRNAQPIDILTAKGKSHKTKAEKEQRKNAEIKFGDQKLSCPDYVSKDLIARHKWNEIAKLYKDVDFVSSGDSGLVGRFCMTFSEYRDLLNRRVRINTISKDSDDVEDYIQDSEEFDYKIKQKLSDMVSTAAILQIDKAINSKMEMLIKMEDRLFLNPLAKIKNVPKKEKEVPKDPLQAAGYDL